MRPRRPEGEPAEDLFRARLSNQLDLKHPLVRLAGLIEWDGFDAEFGARYHETLGRPGIAFEVVEEDLIPAIHRPNGRNRPSREQSPLHSA